MSITADFLIVPQPIAAAVSPAQPRPAVAPATEREGAQNERRQSAKNPNVPLSFRASLSAATLSGVTHAASASPNRPSEGEESSIRPARVPTSGPVELTGAEASDLFSRAIAENARKSQAPAFAVATSHYAASYFAGSAFYARPGETLEVTA